CLLLEMDQAEAAHQLGGEVPFFAAEGGAPGEGNPLRAVDLFPDASWATKVASRAAFTRSASLSIMSSQLISCQRSEPAARYMGAFTRRALVASCIAVAPLGQRRPSLTGLSGLPSIWSSSTVPSVFSLV